VEDVGEHQQGLGLVEGGQRPGRLEGPEGEGKGDDQAGKSEPADDDGVGGAGQAAGVVHGQIGHRQHGGHRDQRRQHGHGGGVGRREGQLAGVADQRPGPG
jgi:hypothetical protein